MLLLLTTKLSFRRTLVGLKLLGFDFLNRLHQGSFRRTLVGLKLDPIVNTFATARRFQTNPCGIEAALATS